MSGGQQGWWWVVVQGTGVMVQGIWVVVEGGGAGGTGGAVWSGYDGCSPDCINGMLCIECVSVSATDFRGPGVVERGRGGWGCSVEGGRQLRSGLRQC